MKILFLDQFSELGGAQRVLLDTVNASLDRGWEAQAAIPGDGPLVERLQSKGIRVAKIPCGPYRAGRKGLIDLGRFLHDLRQQIGIIRDLSSSFQFDLLYVNGPRLLPVAVSSGGRAAVLFHAHSHMPDGLSAKLAQWSIRRTNATVIGCSNSVLRSLGRPIRPSAYVIRNGVADIPFRPPVFSLDKSWRIGMIGRISPEKGQAEFVRAATQVASEFASARFVVCGAPLFGQERYYEQLRRLAAGLPIEFLGWRDDVAHVLNELDLLVVASRQEGMGRIIIEAFAAGIPVVAFPAGGIPELIADHETGYSGRHQNQTGANTLRFEKCRCVPDGTES